MHTLVINGSPHGAEGNTAILTDAFIEGVKECGWTAEVVCLSDLNIEPCCGNLTCWLSAAKECCRTDDMAELLRKVENADMLVYATPLYTFTVSGLMKTFMDRQLSLLQPFMSMEGGICHHPRRSGRKPAIPVLISTCGFPEQTQFSGLRETFRQLFAHSGQTADAMICCAGGAILQNPELKDFTAWYVDAARQAGREVATSAKVSDATQSILDRPLIEDATLYASNANAWFRSMGCEPIGEEARRVSFDATLS